MVVMIINCAQSRPLDNGGRMDGTDPLDVSPSHGLTVTVTVTVTVTRSELHASRMSVLAAHEPFVSILRRQ